MRTVIGLIFGIILLFSSISYGASLEDLLAPYLTDNRFSGTLSFKCNGAQPQTVSVGHCNREKGELCRKDIKYRIGSLSKNFTATAVLRLYEKGKLNLEDKLSAWIPEYDAKNLTLNGKDVTIHNLLSHTSGLPSYEKTQHAKENIWKRAISASEMIEQVDSQTLAFEPGSSYEYSNLGYRLLTLIIERASAQKFEDYLQETLGLGLLTQTGVVLPNQEGLARGYFFYEPEKTWFSLYDLDDYFKDRDLLTFNGSGSLYSTTDELIQWIDALRTYKILRKETFALMLKENLEEYGYGWTYKKLGSTRLAWHNGALSPLGFYSESGFIPDGDFAYALFANVDMTSISQDALKIIESYLVDQCSL